MRVAHRWFADTDDWDGEFEAQAYGWATTYFRILELHLTHFAGQPCAAFDLAAFSGTSTSETWRTLTSALIINRAAQRATSTSEAPGLAGTVMSTDVSDPELLAIRERAPLIKAALEDLDGEDPQLLLHLERPAPGIAHLLLMPMGEQTMVSLRFFLYGERGTSVASEVERAWSEWLAARFPQPEPA